MQRQVNTQQTGDSKELQILENVTNWQSSDNPLAPLSEKQMDLVYEIGDQINLLYCKNEEAPQESEKPGESTEKQLPIIYKNEDFIKWLISIENEIKYENLKGFQGYEEQLGKHKENCVNLYTYSNNTLDSLNDLKEEYQKVTEKTNYLHDLSEQLMTHQRLLKAKKASLNEKLKYFKYFQKCQEGIERLGHRINSKEFIDYLININNAIIYLNDHMNFKESRIYKMKYESLLTVTLNKVYVFVNNIITDTTKQVVNPEFKTHFVSQNTAASPDPTDSTFSLYYGKFQSAASKVKLVLNYLEEHIENDYYASTLNDCQKTYLTQRLPVLSDAVSKALNELKDKHRTDYSILFRSCTLFTMKVCQDEARCYSYFFINTSLQLDDYLGTLCQYLYDTLRPCLILINHIEILAELCGILKSEACSDKVLSDDHLYKYVETVKQLLEDVEERLVFRTNVFFQHDLNGYKPSPGDLAYPEKLEQMENIAIDFKERRPDSRASSVLSLESQEVAHINTAQLAQFRSYTGNSPADLHGMWYPTVKRTLVCLSRLYFCLDRSTFQGLAQEALIVCVKTVQSASDMISARKTPTDGRLFQIKHLLIIREQIAPFQVDFTSKEVGLDFSTVHKAAVDLIHHRGNIFVFGTNNALLEFLLEGTPKVKEYLVDSRKEIDKQLKQSCEAFIAHVTKVLIGNILEWIEKAEHILKIIHAEGQKLNDLSVANQDFGKPSVVAGIVKDAQKNMKTRIPEVQRSMQLYLANRETEFILFRPVKNNIINGFIKIDEILSKGGYTAEDQIQVACPSPEQVNILICSVSLAGEQEQAKNV